VNIIELGGARPKLAADTWLANNATLIGDVTLGEQASVWFGAVARADFSPITIGARTNIQDGCVLHTDPGFPLTIGSGVSAGHRAVLHGCTIDDDVLVGMGSTVLNGARIGAESLVAAGAVVLEGTEIPPRSLVAGVPGKVRRPLTDDEAAKIRENARMYVELAQRYGREATTT
jgi:carbonic anhydrase/acetyltransferase-like protein (isoleucine patch superfamily)